MGNPLNIGSYPQFFSEIESLVTEKGPTFPTLKFSCGTRGRATHLRQRFYGWRMLRFRAGCSPQLAAISVGVDGDIITFTHADESFGLSRQLADQLKDLGIEHRMGTTPPESLMALVKPEEPSAAKGGVVEAQTSASEQEAVLRKLGLIP